MPAAVLPCFGWPLSGPRCSGFRRLSARARGGRFSGPPRFLGFAAFCTRWGWLFLGPPVVCVVRALVCRPRFPSWSSGFGVPPWPSPGGVRLGFQAGIRPFALLRPPGGSSSPSGVGFAPGCPGGLGGVLPALSWGSFSLAPLVWCDVGSSDSAPVRLTPVMLWPPAGAAHPFVAFWGFLMREFNPLQNPGLPFTGPVGETLGVLR